MTLPAALPFPFADDAPERLLRIDGLGWRDGAVTARMQTGPWLRAPSGRMAAGALGVLVDNVLGYAIMGTEETGSWSVSLEISLELVVPVPVDGSDLHAEGAALERDARGGWASGQVVDAAGRVVARGRQRGFFIPVSGARASGTSSVRAEDAPDLLTLLGARLRPSAEGAVLTVDAGPHLTNPLGNLHGGISLCAAELAAAACYGDGSLLRPVSLHVVYVRPLPGGTVVEFSARRVHRGRSVGLVHVVGAAPDGPPCVLATVVSQAP